MQRFLFLLVLVCLCASCQGNRFFQPGTTDPGGGQTASSVKLKLDAEPQGANWRVTLAATNAHDLYQAAGTLAFPAGTYDVLAIEAGGGLGGPQECIFAGKETAPGQVRFAYTRHYYGAGVDGTAALVSVVVVPHGKFTLGDFQLERGQGECVLRDSKKQALALEEVR
jgi:hypothetical protein